MLSFVVAIVANLFVVGLGACLKTVPLLPDHRIVGGVRTTINEHPHQLSFQSNIQTSRHICGASIISSQWAVTAGHCVGGNPSSYSIRAGSSEYYKNGTLHSVKNIIRHPKYNDWTIDYDIALVQINNNFTFNHRVKPINLPSEQLKAGTLVNVTGWGTTTEGGSASSQLMRVSVPIVSNEACQDLYKGFNNITSRMICAGYINTGGKDSCQGDSGGPLSVNGTLYGIVSWGYGCARPHYPGVYTNVANQRSWIREITGI